MVVVSYQKKVSEALFMLLSILNTLIDTLIRVQKERDKQRQHVGWLGLLVDIKLVYLIPASLLST
jgi:hypothetical protein